MASTHFENLSQVPLLSQETIEEGRLELQQIAEMSAALGQGKMPSSDQLNKMVQKLLKSNLLQPRLGSRIAGKVGGGKLSVKGEELVTAARGVLEALVRVGMEKNGDDKIQRFIYAASQASVDVDVDAAKPDIPLPTSAEIREANDAIKQLANLLLTSNNLRDIIGDMVNLGRDLFADAAEQVANAAIETTKASKKAAKKARPSEEERQNSSSPLDDYGLDLQSLQKGKRVKKQVVRRIEDAKDDAEDALIGKASELKEWAEEKLPTDAHDAFIERFKSIIDEVQSQPEYSQSLNTLLGLVRKYASLAAQEIKDVAKSVDADAEVNKEAENAMVLLRQIIESFTGPLDGVFSSADAVITHLKQDDRLKAMVNQLDDLVDRAINDPGYATSSKAQRKVEKLYDEAQDIAKNNAAWKRDADRLVKELNDALEHAANDKALLQLGDSVDRFNFAAKSFVKSSFSLVDVSAWNDLTSVFVPRLLGALHTIPLPRVEFTSADFDAIIDNVRFTSDSFIPDAMFIKNHNELSCRKGYAAYASEFATATTVSFSGLRLAAKDISYYINKKTGWIGLEDYGLMDIIIGGSHGDGLDVTLTIENADERDREAFFKVRKADVSIDGFQLAIHDSQHYIRNFFVRPALKGYVEKQIVQVLEEQVVAAFKAADKKAYELSLKSRGALGAAADPLAFLRGVFAPSGPSTFSSVTSTGVTKVGPKGEWILAVGVEEELLPGRRTGLQVKDHSDIVSRKRAVESLIEEGRHEVEQIREMGEGIVEEVSEEADRIKFETQRKARAEARRNGWRSEVFG